MFQTVAYVSPAIFVRFILLSLSLYQHCFGSDIWKPPIQSRQKPYDHLLFEQNSKTCRRPDDGIITIRFPDSWTGISLLYILQYPHYFITMLPSFHRNFDSHQTVVDFAIDNGWGAFSQDPLSTRQIVAFGSSIRNALTSPEEIGGIPSIRVGPERLREARLLWMMVELGKSFISKRRRRRSVMLGMFRRGPVYLKMLEEKSLWMVGRSGLLKMYLQKLWLVWYRRVPIHMINWLRLVLFSFWFSFAHASSLWIWLNVANCA